MVLSRNRRRGCKELVAMRGVDETFPSIKIILLSPKLLSIRQCKELPYSRMRTTPTSTNTHTHILKNTCTSTCKETPPSSVVESANSWNMHGLQQTPPLSRRTIYSTLYLYTRVLSWTGTIQNTTRAHTPQGTSQLS